MELEKLGVLAIIDNNPAGFDVRDSEQFSLIQEEFAKLTNPSASTPPDPAVIVKNAAELLASKGKDITVAAYLANGLMRQNGLIGLAQGLRILGDLIENYWETLFPPIARMRGRRNSIQWLVDQTSKHLESTTYDPQPISVCDDLKNQIQRVDELLSSRDDESPGLFRLLSLVQAIPLLAEPQPTIAEPPPPVSIVDQTISVQDNQSPAPPSATVTAQSSSLAQVTPLSVPAITNIDDAVQALGSCQKHLIDIADAILSSDVSNPLAFRLVRTSAWLDVFELPPHTNLQTLIPPPKSQIKDMLSAAQGSQSWQSLVQICESNVAVSIFWLDLHRLSELSLSNIGASCDAARNEIRIQVTSLMARLPELPTLKFNDGTPFADSETLEWLSGITQAASQNSAQTSRTADDGLAREISKARGLIQDGATENALELLGSFMRKTASARVKLLCQIELCGIVLQSQPVVSAVPYAESILGTLEQHQLVAWDPELSISALRTCYKAYARTPSQAEYANEILAKLAAIDPAAAYQVTREVS